jgi:hypothetical protein
MNSLLQKNNQASKPVMLHSKAKPYVQAKLTVNEPGDIYEQEADAMADRVMRMSSSETAKPVTGLIGKSLQRKCAHCEEEEKRKKLIMRKAEGGNSGMSVSSSFATSLHASKGGGSPLPEGTRSFMENAFSADFSSVRVHTSSGAAEMSEGINAKAFTYGNDIYFNSSEYLPNSENGKKLLAHELTHVTQQNESNNSTIRRAEVEDRNSVCTRLTDIRSPVNSFVNSVIGTARTSPGVTPISPFINEVLNQTGGSGAVTPIETFIEGLPPSQRFLPNSRLTGTRFSGLPGASGLGIPSMGGLNIYHLHSMDAVHVVGSTAKINGFCVGTDKLGHFFQQGAQYLGVSSRAGATVADAESFGRATEIDRAGLGATGVYSNADLAANLSGLQFWRDLIATPASFTFDVANYISNSWNEYVNPNFYERSIANEIWAVQLTGAWNGSIGHGPTLESVNANLRATTTGTISGTFTINNPSTPVTPWATRAPAGVINGIFTYNTTPVSGSIPSTVLHGSSGAHSATPVSSIIINFDWVLGAQSGKGVWNSNGENHLSGSFGNGISRTNRGLFNLERP